MLASLLLKAALCAAAQSSSAPVQALPSAQPAGAEALVRESAAHYATGDWNGSLLLAEKASAADPKNARAKLQLSMALLKLERWAEAEAEAGRAIELGYNKAAPYNVRSAARSWQDNFEGALADAEKAVSLNPGGAIGYVNRAAAKTGLKKPGDDILNDYRRASEVDARYRSLYDNAQRKYGKTPAPAPAPVVTPHEAKPEAVKPEPQPAPAPAPAPVRRGVQWRRALGLAAGLGVLGFVMWLLHSGWKSRRGLQVRFGSLIAPAPATVELAPGAVVAGRYIVGRLVERRGAIELYDARDLEDAPRAIKRLAPRPEALEAQFALARRAAALRHPGIETAEAVFLDGPRVCIATVPLSGDSLARLKARLPGGKWSPDQALRPLQTACEALSEAHRQGVAHGAITPRAIVVDRGRACLGDFGLAEGEPADDIKKLAACFEELLAGDDPSALSGGLTAVFGRAASTGFRSAEELFQAYRTAVVPMVQ